MDKESSLQKAISIQQHAAQYRFDWKQLEPVFDKLNEEVAELKQAIQDDCIDDIQSEFGDILFVVANIARLLNINPDVALEKTNTKFNNRFNYILEQLNITNTEHQHSLKSMQQQWQIAKRDFP